MVTHGRGRGEGLSWGWAAGFVHGVGWSRQPGKRYAPGRQMFWQRFWCGWNCGQPWRCGRSADAGARGHLFLPGNGGCEGMVRGWWCSPPSPFGGVRRMDGGPHPLATAKLAAPADASLPSGRTRNNEAVQGPRATPLAGYRQSWATVFGEGVANAGQTDAMSRHDADPFSSEGRQG